MYSDFEQISVDLGVKIKKSNTVVEKWPTQLKLKTGQKDVKEEFRLNLGSSFVNTERYVEIDEGRIGDCKRFRSQSAPY